MNDVILFVDLQQGIHQPAVDLLLLRAGHIRPFSHDVSHYSQARWALRAFIYQQRFSVPDNI